MKQSLIAVLATAITFAASPALAAAPGGEAPERPTLQFVEQQKLFGQVTFEHPIPLNSNRISTTVKLIGGEVDGQRWQVRGHNDILEAIRAEFYWPGRNRPHANIVSLLASSDKASEELRLAEQAASREDTYRLWGLGLAMGAGASLSLAYSAGQHAPSVPLLATGVGLASTSLVAVIFAALSAQDSINHFGWAVKTWNAGQ